MKKKENFLESIPKRNGKISFEHGEDGKIMLVVPRDRLIEKLIRKFHKIPEQFTIDLDEFGSCVWKSIDGQNNIYAIGEELKKHFGEEIEPLYPRLATFVRTLVNNKFITMK